MKRSRRGDSDRGNEESHQGWKHFANKTGWQAWGAVVVLSATALLQVGWNWASGAPSPVDRQLEEIANETARSGRYVSRVVRFKPKETNTNATLVIDGQKGSVRSDYTEWLSRASDRIRIYDEIGGELEKRLDFQPTPSRLFSNYSEKFAFNLDVRFVGDLNRDGRDEVIGLLDPLTAAIPFGYPIAIYWSTQLRKYQITPIVSAPPRINGIPRAEAEARAYQEAWSFQTRIRSQSGRREVQVFPSELAIFYVDETTGAIVIGYRKDGMFPADTSTFEIRAWTVDFTRKGNSWPCYWKSTRLRAHLRIDESRTLPARTLLSRFVSKNEPTCN